jgi:hypothetical protein
MTNQVRNRIVANLTTHEVVKPNGKSIVVNSSDKYVTERKLTTQFGLAFARALVGKEFAR